MYLTVGICLHSSADLNECQLNEILCEYNCFNVMGSYECKCPVGYQLAADGYSCVGKLYCLLFGCIEHTLDTTNVCVLVMHVNYV